MRKRLNGNIQQTGRVLHSDFSTLLLYDLILQLGCIMTIISVSVPLITAPVTRKEFYTTSPQTTDTIP
jgi:hypothetical protein